MATTIKTLTDNGFLATEGWFIDPTYTVTAGKRGFVKEIFICNLSTIPHRVTAQTITSGGSPGADDSFFRDLVVDAKSTLHIRCNLVMESEDELWMFTDDFSVVTARISGAEL